MGQSNPEKLMSNYDIFERKKTDGQEVTDLAEWRSYSQKTRVSLGTALGTSWWEHGVQKCGGCKVYINQATPYLLFRILQKITKAFQLQNFNM